MSIHNSDKVQHDFFIKDSIESIFSYAKGLEGKSLLDIIPNDTRFHSYGNMQDALSELFFFSKYQSDEPFFKEARLGFKAIPLHSVTENEFTVFNNVFLNEINSEQIQIEKFNDSSFWKNSSQILFVFYRQESNESYFNFKIELVSIWEPTGSDLSIIKQDWQIIKNRINTNKGGELLLGDTFYLGCEKTSAYRKTNSQDQHSIKTRNKNIFYVLKKKYISNFINSEKSNNIKSFASGLKSPGKEYSKVVDEFEKYYDLNIDAICEHLGFYTNKKSKGYCSTVTRAIIGNISQRELLEFYDSRTVIRTVRLDENFKPTQNISFPAFKFIDIANNDWDSSSFKSILEQNFFFVFFKYKENELLLKRVVSWKMDKSDLLEAKKVYDRTREVIMNGAIVKSISIKGIRKTNFPGSKFSEVCHVRPHAINTEDVLKLPVNDTYTNLTHYTKHSFWLNASYIKNKIYFKNL